MEANLLEVAKTILFLWMVWEISEIRVAYQKKNKKVVL